MKVTFDHLRGDMFGGITAGVVALPLALALGVASGVGPIAGLYSAIIVGFFAAWLGGTQTQITGPTGPMVVVLAGLVASLSGDLALVFTAIVLAGILQVVMGVLGLGQYIRLVPYPVISGFMSGIGTIIIILQLAQLTGHATVSNPVSALSNLPGWLTDINFTALLIGGVTLAMTFLWPVKLRPYCPPPLAALVTGTLLSMVLPAVPILGDIPSALPELHLPVLNSDKILIVVEAAFILALLGSIDSLLTSLVADNITRTRHESNRELIGQGVGNAVAGLFGGIAAAGATMRTVVNIRAGGKTRLSGMVHSLFLLALVLGLSPLAEQIPHAALAGILVKVGIDIIDWSYLKKAHRGPRLDLVLMVVVLTLTVFVDLITAVAVGVVLAALSFVKAVAKMQLEAIENMPDQLDNEEETALLTDCKGQVMVFDFGGPLSFGAAADMGHHVREKTTGNAIIILDFARVPFMDLSAANAIETILMDAKDNDKLVLFSGVNDKTEEVMVGLGLKELLVKNKLFDSRLDALKYAHEVVTTHLTVDSAGTLLSKVDSGVTAPR